MPKTGIKQTFSRPIRGVKAVYRRLMPARQMSQAHESSALPVNRGKTALPTAWRGIEIDATTLLQRSKDIPFSQLDDELLAIDAQAGYCYSLNETAGRVWDLIATPMSLDALCVQLRREYAVDEPTCRREVTALLQGLSDAGLVRVAG